MNTTHLSHAIIALQTAAYCGMFISLLLLAPVYGILSFFCALGLGTAQYFLHDY